MFRLTRISCGSLGFFRITDLGIFHQRPVNPFTFNWLFTVRPLSWHLIGISIRRRLSMYSKPFHLTTNTPRTAVEDMNIHDRCDDVTVTASKAPLCFSLTARCSSTEDHQPPSPLIPPSSLASSQEGGPFGLPLRASNDIYAPSKLARVPSLGRAPMLV
jgi:hypothetical protein